MPDMTAAQAAALWSGLLILLLVILSVRVVLQRQKHRVVLGDGGNADLTLAGRVFGNAAEYIPVGIAALAVLTLLGLPAYAIHGVGGVLFIGRVLHATGLTAGKPTPGRLIGMILTYLALIAAAGMLIVHAFVGVPH
ncbi:MAPEG family protein [Brevundimonas sp.]